MAVSLIPIIIQGVIKLAPPSVAKFLMQHGFKKASQTAVRGKTNIPKVSSRQAKDIVNKDQQTSFSLSKNMSKKDIQKMRNRLQDYGISDKKPVKPGRSITPKKVEDIGPFEWVAKKGQEHQKTLEKYKKRRHVGFEYRQTIFNGRRFVHNVSNVRDGRREKFLYRRYFICAEWSKSNK